MKKNYVILCLGIIFSVSTLRAQLNGVYTIDNTVPSSATNFTSFTQFASTLNLQGVSGPVSVNVGVTSGPYTEQIEIIQYAGASATNSVLINGNGRTITFNATNTALRHTIMLSGADYMTWNNLRVIGTNATSALVVHLWNGSDNNNFNNMYMEAPVNGVSTTQVPYSVSGTSIAATTAGNAGNNNVVNSSTLVGGYYSAVLCGSSAAPFNVNNEVRNSLLRDFYTYGFYNLYCQGSKAIGNVIDRLNRTTVTTTYAVYLSTGSTANELIEGNRIRNLYNGIIGNASTTYAIYITTDATAAAPNIVRNNVISDINNNGILTGIFLSGSDYAYAEHNTIALDDGTSTGNTTHGINATGANDRVRNNNITIGRAGTGSKYGLFFTSAATNMVSDYNNVYISSTAGANFFGSYTSTYNTLATWETGTGFDMNSISVDPQYTNPSGFDYSPGNLAVNNKGLAIGLMYDVLAVSRSPLAPDPGAYEIFNAPCVLAPPGNSFIVPTFSVCPGSQIGVSLQNTTTYTNSGYIVQWFASSNSGPFQAIPGATLNSYVTNPLTSNLQLQATITCSNTNLSTSTLPGSVLMMPVVQDNVPYFESFEALAQNGLPNCYWTASNFNTATKVSTAPASGNRAARTGTNYAYFESKPMPNYFYTNQILLKAGVTYSAALWYVTENIGFNSWPDLSIHVGASQTPTALQQVAAASPVTGQLYNLLSNTFSVATTGYYYVAVRATGSLTGVAPYLTWDDLSITIPCSLNTPTLSVLAPTAPVCQGMPSTLLAGGVSSYSWSNGVQGSANVVSPITHSTYVVYGTDTLSGCSTSISINLTVTPAPAVGAIASSYSICSGQSATLSATGGDSYYWSTGSTNTVTVVSPTISSTYVVAGLNSAGCTASAQVVVQVYTPPVLNATTSSSLICQGESVQLSVQGASTYVWLAPNLYNTGSQVTAKPQSSTMYTVTGTTQNGCSVSSQVVVIVEACTGLAKNTRKDFSIFPNPATDQLFIQTYGGNVSITITDVSGRVVATQLSASELTAINLTNFSAGVYYIQLNANHYNRTEKFIKQ